MNKAIVEYVRFELYNYPHYKQLIENFAIHELLTYKQQLWLTLLIQGIETAMDSMSPDVRKYVRLRYFKKHSYNVAGMTLQLNIAERTLFEWDNIVINTVAKHIGILNTTKRIAVNPQF